MRTGRKAVAHVEFPDQTVVLVKEGSDFTLQGAARRKSLRFAVGEFLVGLKRTLAPEESLEIRTPSAVAAVRGTLFWGLSDSEKNSVWSGFGHKVAITARKKTVVLEPGRTVRVPFGGQPEESVPSTVSKAFIERFAIGGELRGLEQLVDPSLK
ncbi:MAG TPA: FecR domain-containing protein [Nitrospirales bacterium]|nr:FecR domain-containing protein [Nitrospirales bacterium]